MSSNGSLPAAMHLKDAAPDLNRMLTRGVLAPKVSATSAIRRETTFVTMRDGIRLATELYFPVGDRAPAVAVRTPYGRVRRTELLIELAQRGYVVVSQDCRGTGDSEPDTWDYYVYEPEDSFDLVDWITKQRWFNGFVAGFGGSYLASTQWCMATHPQMSTIVPEVGGLGVAFDPVPNYMFVNAYARSVGKGPDKVSIHYSEMERQMLSETLAGGFFNDPLQAPLDDALYAKYSELRLLSVGEGKRWLWRHYCAIPPAQRAELLKLAFRANEFSYVDMNSLDSVFGHQVAYGVHALPSVDPSDACRALRAPTLMITGWYDWGLNDALATWNLLTREAPEPIRSGSRLLITPSAHNVPGYREGTEGHPELERTYRTHDIVDLLCSWYDAVRHNTVSLWPIVTYYLMGANEWHAASTWPPSDARTCALYLGADGTLTSHTPQQGSPPDSYTYRPDEPTPTVGGSIVSYVYTPGSVDVSEVQTRPDVLTYTTATFERDLDVVGPVRLSLYASSSAVDTDFAVHISDVFPDGRAVLLQGGILRARYRNPDGEPELLEPGKVHHFEIDVWATANRFKAGHRLRVDISSADFPRFDRNTNRGGDPGPSVPAVQTVYHDPQYPSHLLISVVGTAHPSIDPK